MAYALSDNKRLKQLAEEHGVSLNKLFEEWSTMAISEFDAETRFRLLAAKDAPSLWPYWRLGLGGGFRRLSEEGLDVGMEGLDLFRQEQVIGLLAEQE